MVNTAHWLLGYRQNMLVEGKKDPEDQTNMVVMTMRADFQPTFALDVNDDVPAANDILMQLVNGAT